MHLKGSKKILENIRKIPVAFKGKKVYEYEGVQVHKQCKHKVTLPAGWQKGS